MKTKRELVVELAEEMNLERLSRVLGISKKQVLRYLITNDKWEPKPRKPQRKVA